MKRSVEKETNLIDLLNKANFGKAYNLDAVKITSVLKEAMVWATPYEDWKSKGFAWPGVISQEMYEKMIMDGIRGRKVQIIGEKILNAMLAGKTNVLRQVVDIIGWEEKKPVREIQAVIARGLLLCAEKNISEPSGSEWIKIIWETRKIRTDRRTVRRIYKLFGRRLSGRPGRPKNPQG